MQSFGCLVWTFKVVHFKIEEQQTLAYPDCESGSENLEAHIDLKLVCG